MVTWTPTFISYVIEFGVAVINIFALFLYYWKTKLTVIGYSHIAFSVVLMINQIISLYISINGGTTACPTWNFQGYTKNLAEAAVDWIFTLRVYYLERDAKIKYFWLFLYTSLDVIPRIASLAMYQNVVLPNGKIPANIRKLCAN